MSSSKHFEKTSKFLSLILRHKPEVIGLQLDAHGWANIDELVGKARASDRASGLDHSIIRSVVDTSDKRRFVISEDGQRIRANQGHSVDIDLQLKPLAPPERLYHGTATQFVDSILCEGLKPKKRQYVHLSTDIETATSVGQRHGKPIILTINARLMHDQGFEFFLSDNDIWLTKEIPVEFVACDARDE